MSITNISFSKQSSSLQSGEESVSTEPKKDENLISLKDISDYFEDLEFSNSIAESVANYIINYLSDSSSGISMEQYQLIADDESVDRIIVASLVINQDGDITLDGFSSLFGDEASESIWQSHGLNPDDTLSLDTLSRLIEKDIISINSSGVPELSIAKLAVYNPQVTNNE